MLVKGATGSEVFYRWLLPAPQRPSPILGKLQAKDQTPRDISSVDAYHSRKSIVFWKLKIIRKLALKSWSCEESNMARAI